jgi:predicted Zn-dependent protease
VVSRAAHIRHNNAYYLVAGLVSSIVFRQVDATFLGSIRSFRPLSAAEAAAIRPQRVNLYVVQAGDTWASIAARSAGAVKPASLAVMNHAAPNSQPPVGTQIKIVVAD